MAVAFFLLLILPGLVPAVIIALAPSWLVRALTGWAVLAYGMLALDLWTTSIMPYDDDGVIPNIDNMGLFISGAFLVAAVLYRLGDLDETLPQPVIARFFSRSAIPVGMLIAVAFMHWLRNRLAGAEPAILVHLAVLAGSGLLLLFGVALVRRGFARVDGIAHGLSAFAAFASVLVVANALMGYRVWIEAYEFAGGQRYCLMTYGGSEYRREAKSGWDLSPLVNREYGIWAISKTPFLVIDSPTSPRSYRRIGGKWKEVSYEPPHCSPRDQAAPNVMFPD